VDGRCRVPVCASLARSLQELITTSEWVVPRLVMKVSFFAPQRHQRSRERHDRFSGKG
jgi:hypothetical protein